MNTNINYEVFENISKKIWKQLYSVIFLVPNTYSSVVNEIRGIDHVVSNNINKSIAQSAFIILTIRKFALHAICISIIHISFAAR
jgi:hypothetical protein